MILSHLKRVTLGRHPKLRELYVLGTKVKALDIGKCTKLKNLVKTKGYFWYKETYPCWMSEEEGLTLMIDEGIKLYDGASPLLMEEG